MTISDPESAHERFRRKFRPKKKVTTSNMRGRVAPVRRGKRNNPNIGEALLDVCQFIVENKDNPEVFEDIEEKQPFILVVEHMMAVTRGGWTTDEEDNIHTDLSGKVAELGSWDLQEDGTLLPKSTGKKFPMTTEQLYEIRERLSS